MPYRKPAESAEKLMEKWYEHTLKAMDTILEMLDEIEIIDARYDLGADTPDLDEVAPICEDYIRKIRDIRSAYANAQDEFFKVMPSLWQLLNEHQQEDIQAQFRELMSDIRGDLAWFSEHKPIVHERLTALCSRNIEHWSTFQSTAEDELEVLYSNVKHGTNYIGQIIDEAPPSAAA